MGLANLALVFLFSINASSKCQSQGIKWIPGIDPPNIIGKITGHQSSCIEDRDPPGWLLWEVETWRSRVEPMLFGRRPVSSALVLAVIAEESQGLQHQTSYANAVGIMQIIPREWLGSADFLSVPENNISVGTLILAQAIEKAEGDVRLALAWYNCGEARVSFKFSVTCGPRGGFFYADRVLNYWCPYFEVDPADNSCAANANDIVYRFGNLVERNEAEPIWIGTQKN